MKRILIRVSILGATLAALFTGWACHTAAPSAAQQSGGTAPAAPVPLGGAYQYVLPPGPAGYIPQSAGPGQPAPWVPAAFGQASAIYGDGSDGTVDGTGLTGDGGSPPACFTWEPTAPGGGIYIQNRDCYFASLTIPSGVNVVPASFRTFVQQSLVVNGSLNADGLSGSVGGVSTSWGGGCDAAGNVSGISTVTLGYTCYQVATLGSSAASGGSGVNYGLGGCGGASSFGGCTGGSCCPGAIASSYGRTRNLEAVINGYLFRGGYGTSASAQPISGGGSGYTASSANGGGAGGVLVLVAQNISGSGTISANGGAGMDNGTYSSGGGGGGYIGMVSHTTTITPTATGGAAGVGHAGAAAGSPGTVLRFTF